MDIAALQQEAYEISASKGWHDEERTFGEVIALVHSELSEALEEWRKPDRDWGKITEEFADVFIRLADSAETWGLNLTEAIAAKNAYNRTRKHRHGGKAI